MKLTFIDAAANQNLLQYLILKNTYKRNPVYRFQTLSLYGIPLEYLHPFPDILELEITNPLEFDLAYANQLMNNQYSFVDLMTVMHALQQSEEVFINCRYADDRFVSRIDSLIKFIYERYSVKAFIVKAVEDINELQFGDFESPIGYQNYISDFSRFASLSYTKEQLENYTTD